MRRDLEQPESNDNNTVTTWADRIAFTAAALATIAAINNSGRIRKGLEVAQGKLPLVYKWAKNQALEKSAIQLIRSRDAKEAEKVFTGLMDKERGSERFGINRSDVAYLVDSRTDLLVAETMTYPKTTGFSPIHSYEITRGEDGSVIQYFAVRLTPRKFDPPWSL